MDRLRRCRPAGEAGPRPAWRDFAGWRVTRPDAPAHLRPGVGAARALVDRTRWSRAGRGPDVRRSAPARGPPATRPRSLSAGSGSAWGGRDRAVDGHHRPRRGGRLPRRPAGVVYRAAVRATRAPGGDQGRAQTGPGWPAASRARPGCGPGRAAPAWCGCRRGRPRRPPVHRDRAGRRPAALRSPTGVMAPRPDGGVARRSRDEAPLAPAWSTVTSSRGEHPVLETGYGSPALTTACASFARPGDPRALAEGEVVGTPRSGAPGVGRGGRGRRPTVYAAGLVPSSASPGAALGGTAIEWMGARLTRDPDLPDGIE